MPYRCVHNTCRLCQLLSTGTYHASHAGAGNPLASTHHPRLRLLLQVHNLTIRAKGKILLENTLCSITGGRRYGLVGPNGMGKSTLLRMLARRQIPVPETLDVLLVEQVRPALLLCEGLCYAHGSAEQTADAVYQRLQAGFVLQSPSTLSLAY